MPLRNEVQRWSRIIRCTHTVYPGIRKPDAHTARTKETSSHKDNRYDKHKRSFGGYETARADPVEFQLTSVAQYCTSREGRNQCVITPAGASLPGVTIGEFDHNCSPCYLTSACQLAYECRKPWEQAPPTIHHSLQMLDSRHF